ncbi:choice-of-anchor G family protein [Arthrobacter globiformis]|uniref:choice-of-anchor G family protein n=1 Tax=Arthrobacter globiformis TaxID=1665 RepID=UPI002791BAA5|nr:choice-of-anchor G family protein [Arthrobacter globiformis]MDQ0620079.1 hypothetical protein [Arthrobacter globiformis]
MKAQTGAMAGRLRRLAPLAVFSVATMGLLTATSGTLAAWTDDEYVSAGAGVMVAGDCSTTTLFQTQSAARELSGSLGGEDLDTLAAVHGISLRNTAGAVFVDPATATRVDPVTFTSALEAGAFGSPLLSAAVGLNQPAGSTGAYTQWARAKASGQAGGAAGLVSDQSGAIDGTGTANGSASTPTAASVNLASFIPASQAAMTLDVGALASSSEVDACMLNNGWPALNPSPVVTRSYGIAGLRLNLSADSIKPLTTSVSGILDSTAGDLDALSSPTGSLATAIKAGVKGLVPDSSGLGVGSVTTKITFRPPDLTAARQLLGETLTDGVVTVDLANSRMSFDLSKLVPGPAGLNGRAPNTELVLDDAAVQDLTQRTSVLLQKWGDSLTGEVKKAVNATSVEVDTKVPLTLAGVPLAVVTLHNDATVEAFASGSPPAPVLSTEVLGTVGLNLLGSVTSALLDGTGEVVAGALQKGLFTAGGLLPMAEAAIRSAVVPVAAEAGTALAPLANALSLTVNVQPDQPGAPTGNAEAGRAGAGQYKVSALRVGAVGTAAELYFATASAGPVAFRPAGVG